MSLYAALKPQLEPLVDHVMEFGAQQLRKRGTFLPMAFTATGTGVIGLLADIEEQSVGTSLEILPLLRQRLRKACREVEAVEVAALLEWVKVQRQGEAKQTDAVKVHVHHRRGLAAAFYLPASKSFWRGWQFGEIFATPAEPLVEAWPG